MPGTGSGRGIVGVCLRQCASQSTEHRRKKTASAAIGELERQLPITQATEARRNFAKHLDAGIDRAGDGVGRRPVHQRTTEQIDRRGQSSRGALVS